MNLIATLSRRFTKSLTMIVVWSGLTVHISAKAQTSPVIEVRAQVSMGSEGTLKCIWTAKNAGKVEIYIIDSVKQANGSEGPSIESDSSSPDESLKVGYKLFPLDPRIQLTVNDSGGHLLLLKPGETHTGETLLRFPMRPTLPPYTAFASQKDIQKTAIRRLIFEVGAIPASDVVRHLIVSRPSGWFNGVENLADKAGREDRLVTHQQIAESPPILLP